jgi:hypothetical protein
MSFFKLRARIILAIFLSLGVLGFLSLAPQGANFVSAQIAPEADINAPEVQNLVEARNISKAEAKKRITWQNRASDLNKQLRQDLPANRFGGVWIDENSDRVKVGIVDGLSSNDVQKKKVDDRIAFNGITDATDIVAVKYSQADLEGALNWITDQLLSANQGVEWPIQVELNTDKNKVTLTLPTSDAQLTKQQTTLLATIHKQYGAMIGSSRSSSKVVPEACNEKYCDGYLRGGVALTNSTDYTRPICTAGFTVQGASGQKYVLTAGHCRGAGGEGWATKNTAGTIKKIGPTKNSKIYRNGGHDGMTIEVSNSYNWTTKGWIYMREGLDLWGWDGPSRNTEYDITDSGTNGELVNQRICKSGAFFGSSCGPVKSTNVSITYSNGYQVVHIVRAQYCSRGGDSGSPIVRNHIALGVHVATGTSDDCSDRKYYASIKGIFGAFVSEYGQHYNVF